MNNKITFFIFIASIGIITSSLADSDKNYIVNSEEYHNSETFTQMNGKKFRKGPQFPNSESYSKESKYDYPKEITPGTPTMISNSGVPFITTLGSSHPNKFINDNSYREDETFTPFRKTKQFSTFGPEKNQFPHNSTYRLDNTYQGWTQQHKYIHVSPGGYPNIIFPRKKTPHPVKKEIQPKALIAPTKRFDSIKIESSSNSNDTAQPVRNEGEI